MARSLEIREQAALGVARLVDFTATGIRHRLLRSAVTLVVIATAVAFFVNLVAGDLALRRAAREAAAEIRSGRVALAYAAYVTRPLTLEQLLRELADERLPMLRADLARFGGWTEPRGVEIAALAATAVRHLDFLAGLGGAARAEAGLEGEPVAALDRLADPARLDAVRMALGPRGWRRLPGSAEELAEFGRRWTVGRPELASALARRNAAAEQVARRHGVASLVTWLATDGAAALGALAEAGFVLEEPQASQVTARAAADLNGLAVDQALALPAVKQALAVLLNRAPEKITAAAAWNFMADPGRVERLNAVVARRDAAWGGLEPAATAAAARERIHLAALEELARAGDENLGGFRVRTVLLIAASMLVCMVGVTNAMLMAVTERFQEIATLKCLGALDGTIVAVFLLEAVALGASGGVAGSIAGLGVAAVRLGLEHGAAAALAFPPGATALALAGAVALGMGLAAVAAVYPALRAARLAPMEAMRIE